MDKRLEGSQRLRGGEGAVTGAVHESLTQQFGVPFRANNTRIRLLVLVNHKPIASGVHCEYRNIQFSVEADVPVQILHSSRISRNARGCIEGVQILIQIQSSLLVESHDFTAVG